MWHLSTLLNLLNPPRRPPDKEEKIWIPDGPEGTARTLEVMAAVAHRDSRYAPVRRLAGAIFDGAPYSAPIALEAWMRARWITRPDPPDVEWIKPPGWRVADDDYAGDCDDAATFAAALLLADPGALEGWRMEFCAVRMPDKAEFSHVWLECDDGVVHVDIDPIVPAAHLPVRGFAETMRLELRGADSGSWKQLFSGHRRT